MHRIGIVGAGTMGTRQAQMLSSKLLSPRAKLVGVCDTSLKRAKALAKSYEVPAYDDLERFLKTEKPDAIYIAVPDDLHREPVITAAKHKVPILVEKPLATTTEDAAAIVKAIKAAGIVAEVNFSNRWNPPFIAAHDSIKSGKIGEVVTINARLSNRVSLPTKLLSWAGSTTAGWFLLSHTIDLATWLSGKKAVSVYANGVKKKLLAMGVPTYDYIHAIVRYEDGTDSMFETVWMLPDGTPAPIDFKYQIIGSEGAIHINTQDQTIQVTTQERLDNVLILQWGIPRFHSFLDTLEGGPIGVSVEDGLENTRILVAMHRSLETGKPVKV